METIVLKRKLIAWANGRPDIFAVYLYGSQVEGHANALSDVDVAVLINGTLEAEVLWALEDRWSAEWGESVDLRLLNLAPVGFQYEVITSSELLWERDSISVAEFESLVRRKFWDLKPLLEENWAFLKAAVMEKRSESERIEYQATLDHIRAVHRRVRETSRPLPETTSE